MAIVCIMIILCILYSRLFLEISRIFLFFIKIIANYLASYKAIVVYGATEVPEICREEGAVCWDGVQDLYVSCFSLAGQNFPHKQAKCGDHRYM